MNDAIDKMPMASALNQSIAEMFYHKQKHYKESRTNSQSGLEILNTLYTETSALLECKFSTVEIAVSRNA